VSAYYNTIVSCIQYVAIHEVVLVLFQVPDRGGRAWELEPPPPEMPSFMKRQDAPQGQRPQSK